MSAFVIRHLCSKISRLKVETLQLKRAVHILKSNIAYETNVGIGLNGLKRKSGQYEATRCMAGHSKWQNIKHTKQAKDAERATLFAKLSQLIKVAVSEGGSPDPKLNSLLANAVAQAKKANMPMSKIESQIKQSMESKDQFKSRVFEIQGPRGSFVLVEVHSDKISKLENELRHLLKRVPGFSLVSNAARGQFDLKGLIITETISEDGKSISIDKATEDAIVAGAEEVQELEHEDGNIFEFYCDFYELNSVRKNLEELGTYLISTAEKEYVPKMYISLNETESQALDLLYEKLEPISDIVNTFTNAGNKS